MIHPLQRPPLHPPPCIIVPVFNAPRETRECLLSVLRETRPPYRLIVLDDASTDPFVLPMLTQLASDHTCVELHAHENNKGFAANVNFGMVRAQGDVVLLNSDTVVTRAWLDKLVASAYSRPDVATVTPVSNAAGAFSVPDNNSANLLPPGFTLNNIAREAARLAAPLQIEAPTGNGFCLYIRRHALDRLGLFDADTFPHIAEENDFCQRALAAGLVNLVDTSCYIYHAQSASVSDATTRANQLSTARQLIDQRYPEYTQQVRRFLATPELQAFRARLRCALKYTHRPSIASRPRILSVVHAGKGGMVHTNRDLMHALLREFDTHVLRCDLAHWELFAVDQKVPIAKWQFSEQWRATSPPDVARRLALRSILQVLSFDLVHFRTLIATGPEILSSIAGTGPRILISFHDFATICPTIQLIDDTQRYCGGYCTPGNGRCRVAKRWFGDVQNLKHDGVYRWRERMAASLPLADAFVTTTESTKKLITEHFPVLRTRTFVTIEHGREMVADTDIAVEPSTPMRVVAFGAFNASKGIHLMQTIFEMNARSEEGFEFHIFGDIYAREPANTPHVFYHGSYEREALPYLLRTVAPSCAMICSIWPETYCHTLTEAWMCGLPVVASDIGVLSERIKNHRGGILVDPYRPHLWLAAMRELSDSTLWHSLKDEVQAIQLPTIDDMANNYALLYKEVLRQ